MSGFKVTVKGGFYELKTYKEFMNEWDLSVDGKMLCDSVPYSRCIEVFLDLIKDTPAEIEKYIASHKHLIGCEVYDIVHGSFTIRSVFKNESYGLFFNDNENEPFDSLVSFYLDDETLGTYEEYMQLHYPEHERIWRHQL